MNELLHSVLTSEDGRTSTSLHALAAQLEDTAYEPWFDTQV